MLSRGPESMAAQTAITLPVPEFLVIGDAFLDVQCGGLAQLPRWDADELVPRPIEFLAGGGGLNTACHLARAGRRVELRCALGDDDAGAKLRSAAANAGVAVVPLAAHAAVWKSNFRRPTRRRRDNLTHWLISTQAGGRGDRRVRGAVRVE